MQQLTLLVGTTPGRTGGGHPTSVGSAGKNRNSKNPTPAMISAGTKKERAQSDSTKLPATRDPRMFPTLVWLFQMPNIRPKET
jgi:hypothetical protein